MFIHHYSTATRYEQVYGVITDRQGSIMALYNTQGNIVYETTYDAWGRERNPISADYTATTTRPIWLIRGYTGHEHLTEFGLINMNGRLYDPQLARMLSPDNFVQDATSTQGFNRYSYVLNNPLKYKDPSGEFIPILIPIAIGVLAGGFAGYQIGKAEGATGWEMVGYIAGGAVIGGVAGWAGGAIGGAIAGANFAGASAVGAIVGGASSGAISGGGFAALGGGDIGEGMWKGAVTGAVGGFVGGAIGGGWGAFFGGATAGGVGTALYGGSTEQIIQNALIGGVFGLGAYEISTYANYKLNYNGNLNYGGYRRVSAAIGRANFWEGEATWYEMPDGSVVRMKWRPFVKGIDPEPAPEGALYEAHTHPRGGEGFEYFGKRDISNYQRGGNPHGLQGYKVYGWENVYTLSADKVPTLTGLQPNWTPAEYEPWAIKYGLNIGTPHGFSLYYHNVYWYGR